MVGLLNDGSNLKHLAGPAGDTCQTIARGIGFRFEDIRTLFYDESVRRKVGACSFATTGDLEHMMTVGCASGRSETSRNTAHIT